MKRKEGGKEEESKGSEGEEGKSKVGVTAISREEIFTLYEKGE